MDPNKQNKKSGKKAVKHGIVMLRELIKQGDLKYRSLKISLNSAKKIKKLFGLVNYTLYRLAY